jgi:hypothetical protein
MYPFPGSWNPTHGSRNPSHGNAMIAAELIGWMQDELNPFLEIIEGVMRLVNIGDILLHATSRDRGSPPQSLQLL